MATRAELKERVRRRLIQFLPNSGEAGFAGDPLTLDDWVTDVTDEIARRCWCWFKTVTSPLVVGQREYCLPDNQEYTEEEVTRYVPELVEAQTIEILTDGGERRLPLRLLSVSEFEQGGRGTYWRNQQNGTPCYAVVAAPRVELYPAPSYAEPAGLSVRGWFVPGKSWHEDSDTFPLSRMAEDVAVLGTSLRWAEAEAHNPRMAAQVALLRSAYERGIRDLYGRTIREGF